MRNLEKYRDNNCHIAPAHLIPNINCNIVLNYFSIIRYQINCHKSPNKHCLEMGRKSFSNRPFNVRFKHSFFDERTLFGIKTEVDMISSLYKSVLRPFSSLLYWKALLYQLEIPQWKGFKRLFFRLMRKLNVSILPKLCQNEAFHRLGPLGRVGHRVAMSVCHKSCNCR